MEDGDDNMDVLNDTSYDDMDLESNQSSDDELPDVLSQESKKSKSDRQMRRESRHESCIL